MILLLIAALNLPVGESPFGALAGFTFLTSAAR